MIVRSYQRRDFDDCNWLQQSFYKWPASQEELHKKLENPSWVAVDKGWNGEDEVVGNIITSESPHLNCPLIWSIVVAKPFRGQGIGSKLMDAAENYYKGRAIYLHVEPRNSARKFYEDRGYQVAREIQDFFGPSYPAVEMLKTL